MTNFTAIELASLPSPEVVEALDFETILAAMKADFAARYPDHDADLESDPVAKLLEVAAYRELGVRQRVNDAARAVMVAFATGSDLDNLAALVPVVRNAGEADASFRGRVQLAPEAFSVAGPHGAYRYHALSASARVKDVAVESPTPGDVVVTVLSTEGDGTPATREAVTDAEATLDGDSAVLDGTNITALVVNGYAAGTDYTFTADASTVHRLPGGGIAANETLTVSYERAAELELVEAALSDEDVRPLTDRVTVQGATVTTYAVDATLTVYRGPDPEVVRRAALDAVDAYVKAQHRLGYDVTLSGLYRALHQPGVQNVVLASPAADVAVAANEAAFCSAVTVNVGDIGV